MSTIAQIIALVDETKPNAFSESVKVRWIAELDGKIAVDVFLMHHSETAQFCYSWPESMNTEPLVPFPHDDMYSYWLEAKIDYANGEYNKYQNTMESYNESYGNFVRWFGRTHKPAQGGGGCWEQRSDVSQYYITAYGLAVKQGYRGTLDAWLASLKGDKGDPGTSPYEFAVAGGFAGTEAEFLYKLLHDGKTAWEYAVEGGYKGTEAEFAALMADAAVKADIPAIDATLSVAGQAADAAATGAALKKKVPIGLYSRDTFWVDSTADPKTPTFWDQVIGVFDSMPVGTVEYVHAIVVNGYGSQDSNEPAGGGYRVTITKYGGEDYGVVEAVNYSGGANNFHGPRVLTRLKIGTWQNVQYPFVNIYNSVSQVLNTMLGVVEDE